MRLNALLLDSQNTSLTYPVQGQIEILETGTNGKIISAVFRQLKDDGTYSVPVEVKQPSFLSTPDVNEDQLQNNTSDTLIEFSGRDLPLPITTMVHFFPHPDDVLGQPDLSGPSLAVYVNNDGNVEINTAGAEFAFVPKDRGSVVLRVLETYRSPVEDDL